MGIETKDTTKKHALPSGATLHLGRPSYGAAARLRNALARAFGAKTITPEEMKLGLEGLKENPSAGGAMVSRLLTALSSDDVEAALFACLEQATYEPKGAPGVLIKFSAVLLDHEDFGDDARTDLYPIFMKTGEAALKPFLAAIGSAYLAFLGKKAAGVPA